MAYHRSPLPHYQQISAEIHLVSVLLPLGKINGPKNTLASIHYQTITTSRSENSKQVNRTFVENLV